MQASEVVRELPFFFPRVWCPEEEQARVINMKFLPLTQRDEPLVWRFLALATHSDAEEVQTNPLLARYAEGWGRRGDFGLSAQQVEKGKHEVVGLIWSRLFLGDARGFGFVAPDVPELSLAVETTRRNKGLGQKLLERYLASAKHRFPAVSLNVRQENIPAIRLYERAGFHRIEGSEIDNRTGGVSFNMILRF